MSGKPGGRANQKARTRQAIVRAAGTLLARGQKPNLDEIAAEAQVSRATAYRYFPGLDALLSEAAVDLMVPSPEDLFADAPADPAQRVTLVDEIFDKACHEREVALRLMLARALEQSIDRKPGEPPLRQNRRVPLLEKALAPIETKLGREGFTRLVQALAVVIGTESLLALEDVVGLDPEQARTVRRWAIEALLAAALKEADQAG